MTAPFTGLPALATTTDAERFGYNLPAATAPQLLDRASTRIRNYARQAVTRVEDDVATLRPIDGSVILPQRPADKPTHIMADDGLGNLFNVPYFDWNGRKVRCPHKLPAYQLNELFRLYAVPISYWAYWPYVCLCTARTAQITYSHGFTTIPDELLDLTCSVADRMANTTAGIEYGVRSETIGDYSVTYGVDSLETASGLLPGEKMTVNRIFGRPRMNTISLSS